MCMGCVCVCVTVYSNTAKIWVRVLGCVLGGVCDGPGCGIVHSCNFFSGVAMQFFLYHKHTTWIKKGCRKKNTKAMPSNAVHSCQLCLPFFDGTRTCNIMYTQKRQRAQ